MCTVDHLRQSETQCEVRIHVPNAVFLFHVDSAYLPLSIDQRYARLVPCRAEDAEYEIRTASVSALLHDSPDSYQLVSAAAARPCRFESAKIFYGCQECVDFVAQLQFEFRCHGTQNILRQTAKQVIILHFQNRI